jgi:cell division septation protein DedD
MQDDSVREIQLNGKQLVFLFMTATAAAVVIFLCGVMVGRGVSSPPALAADAAIAPLDPTADVIFGTQDVSSGSPAELLAVFEEPPIEADAEPIGAPIETTPDDPAPVAAVVPDPVPEPPAEPVAETRAEARPVEAPSPASTREAAAAEAAGAPEYSTEGFVVQVTAVRARSDADSIAADLNSKGFRAFVSSPETGAPFFRVRVGRFQDRRDAERVKNRLEAEEQLAPWITR